MKKKQKKNQILQYMRGETFLENQIAKEMMQMDKI